MLFLRTILHPTDFSSVSTYALSLACSLDRDHGSRLNVLHVAELPVIGPGGGLTPPPGGDWAAIARKLHEIQPIGNRIPVVYRLEEGNPAAEILRVARLTQCDLIVMESHGRTGLTRLLMGSVAEQVVRKAPCPVLVVKARVPSHAQPESRPTKEACRLG
jgi:nucleotide-binding universal stress UspA family protein